ncbi:MAG: LysR family transcriptional regulator [Firmicutes bacterium]|nr:LysR family transcriptional regulator [Bacillota bacterium]
MNIQHLRCALEIERVGSINRAAENLYMGQPNLSRAIKELEATVGVVIFERSSKGMIPTPEGEEFLERARKLIEEIDEMEETYKAGAVRRRRFSVSVPRADYVDLALAEFSRSLGDAPADIFYEETGAARAIKNILDADYRFAVISFPEREADIYERIFDEKSLAHEVILSFKPQILISRASPLAARGSVSPNDLHNLIMISDADREAKRRGAEIEADRVIFASGRAGSLSLLSSNPEAYMISPPVREVTRQRYGLTALEIDGFDETHRDALVYRRGCKFTELDFAFRNALFAAAELT